MFDNHINIGYDTFAKQSVRPLSATYSDNNQTLSNPRTLTISHEIGKSGQVSSAVILDDSAAVPVGNTLVNDRIRVLHKIQYNPMVGRADLAAHIREASHQLCEFVSDDTNLNRILNRES